MIFLHWEHEVDWAWRSKAKWFGSSSKEGLMKEWLRCSVNQSRLANSFREGQGKKDRFIPSLISASSLWRQKSFIFSSFKFFIWVGVKHGFGSPMRIFNEETSFNSAGRNFNWFPPIDNSSKCFNLEIPWWILRIRLFPKMTMISQQGVKFTSPYE